MNIKNKLNYENEGWTRATSEMRVIRKAAEKLVGFNFYVFRGPSDLEQDFFVKN